MDQQPNKSQSRWQKFKQKGLDKLKEMRKNVQESTKPIRDTVKEAGEYAGVLGDAAHALYIGFPKALYDEFTKENKDERQEPQVQNAVQQADEGKRREARLQSEGMQGRQGKADSLRRRVNAEPPRRTGPKKSVPRPPQLRREER